MKVLNQLLQNTHDFYILVNKLGVIVDISHAFLQEYKIPRKDLIDKPIDEFLNYDSSIEKSLSNCLNSDAYSIPEVKIIGSEENSNIFKLTCTKLENDYLIHLKDISHTKFLQKIIHDIEKTASIGYWVVEPGSETPWWSRGTYEIHAAPNSDQFDINGAIDFYVGGSKDQIIADFTKCLLEGIPFDGTYRFKDANNDYKWVRSVGQSELVIGHDTRRVFGVFQDVTKTVSDQEELANSQERLSLALASSKMGVWEYQLKDDQVYWDEQMFKIYAATPNTQSSYDIWINSVHPEDQLEAENKLRESIRTLEDFHHRFRIIRPDKTIRHIQACARVMVNKNGKATKLIGLNWDITDSIQQEEELIQAKESAEKAALAKSNFLSNMSHEIRTPMNGMLGYMELLDETSLDEEQKHYLAMITRSGKSLLSIINDILDYSKIESGHLHIKPCYSDLSETISDLTAIFQPMIQQKKLELIIHKKFAVNDMFYFDHVRVKQILTNLISNAIKYTQKGKISLTIESDNQQGFMFFHVEDTGIGISPEIQANLFEPFERDEERVKFIEGTGLGLSIVKKLLDLMGGYIQCKSQEGQGSKFTVTIPSHSKKAAAS